MQQKALNRPRIIALFVLLLLTFVLALQSHSLSKKSRNLKNDLVELSAIKYGLFNVDEWKALLTDIIAKKIQDLEVTGANRAEMEQKISGLLNEIIENTENHYKVENKGSFKGWLKRSGASVFGIFDHLKREIPDITASVLDFLEQTENREAIRHFISHKIEEYAKNTFAETDYTLFNSIIEKYGFEDKIATIEGVQEQHDVLRKKRRTVQGAILVLSLLVAVSLFLKIKYHRIDLSLYTIYALILLVLGLSLPMIDIDARISSVKFTLLGEHIDFSNQILYFKSKSILEMVGLMLSQRKWDVGFVGFLVLNFSVLFPVFKLIAANIHLYSAQLRKNKIIQFLVFKTGKWSMADVMVVAIFMSYIGFSGIIGEQLRQLDEVSENLEVITTNHSTLQAGFFFFTAFVVISILISQKINSKGKETVSQG